MYDKFGELNSCEEINELAENLFNEGDMKSIETMAKENGIPEEYVKMYLDGEIPMLCDAAIAAVGKIDIEAADLKPKGIMLDWVQYIKIQCALYETIAKAVREKGKSLKGCIAELLAWSFKNQQDVDKEIIKKAGISSGRVTLGIPEMGTAKKIIRKYYAGEAK